MNKSKMFPYFYKYQEKFVEKDNMRKCFSLVSLSQEFKTDTFSYHIHMEENCEIKEYSQ